MLWDALVPFDNGHDPPPFTRKTGFSENIDFFKYLNKKIFIIISHKKGNTHFCREIPRFPQKWSCPRTNGFLRFFGNFFLKKSNLIENIQSSIFDKNGYIYFWPTTPPPTEKRSAFLKTSLPFEKKQLKNIQHIIWDKKGCIHFYPKMLPSEKVCHDFPEKYWFFLKNSLMKKIFSTSFFIKKGYIRDCRQMPCSFQKWANTPCPARKTVFPKNSAFVQKHSFIRKYSKYYFPLKRLYSFL